MTTLTKAPARKPTSKTETIRVRGAEIAAAARDWLDAFRPKPHVPLSVWMAKHARLDDGSRFRAFPFQREIADAFTTAETSQVSVRKSSRIGYSTLVQGFIGYAIAEDPRRLLIYQPTIDDAEKYSRDDLEPVLSWPAVTEVATFKPRHADNQVRAKRFKGGWIQIKGANSPKEFRRVTADVVLLEEPDGYPWSAKDEGDPARLAFKRNLTSPRRFSAAGSTPKVKGLSRIDGLFEQGSQEHRYLPCPHCGTMQVLVFGDGTGPGIRWEPRYAPTRAWYRCEQGCDIEEGNKPWMDENGEWRAHNPAAFPRHRSFHIWAGYSQHAGAAWLEIAREFLEVRKDPNLLRTFVNQTLGEAWQEKGEAPEWQRLYDRREKGMSLGTPPEWAGVLVGSVDVQRGGGGRLELDIWAFGPDRRRAFVEHIEIDGRIADAATWKKLDEQVSRDWLTADGRRLRLARVGVDSGDGENTMHVYAWCRRHPGFAMALKGRHAVGVGQAIAGPTWQDLSIGGRKLKRGVRLWTVGTSMLKLELYGQLQLERPIDGEDYPDGYIYLPEGTTDEWIKQLVAEQLVNRNLRNGRQRADWEQTRPRNEALDNAIYARAVAIGLGVDRWSAKEWGRLLGTVSRKSAPKPVPQEPAEASARQEPPQTAVTRPPKFRRPNPFTSRGR